jgi:hypothetical protein
MSVIRKNHYNKKGFLWQFIWPFATVQTAIKMHFATVYKPPQLLPP